MMDSSGIVPVKKAKKQVFVSRRSGVGTGTTSLLMIFTILCFATLALLSLSTAASNRRIQQRSQQSAASFAVAEGVAAARLADIDAALAQLQAAKAMGEEAYYQAATERLQELGCEAGTDAHKMQFTLPIDRYNSLVVIFEVNPPNGEARFTVLQKASERIGDWAPEENASYWMGS